MSSFSAHSGSCGGIRSSACPVYPNSSGSEFWLDQFDPAPGSYNQRHTDMRRRSWELVIDVDRDGTLPPFLQIARALANDIQRGRLRPGDRLPGSRRLAESLHVHRNTCWRRKRS